MSAVGVGRVGVEVRRVSPTVSLRSSRSVVKTGRAVDDRDRVRGDRRAGRLAVVDGDAHADLVAAVAVAGRGEVERRARGADDVDAVARPLVARGQRVALGVVAGHGGGQRLAGRRAGRGDRDGVDDRRGVGRRRDRPGERVGGALACRR